MSDQAIYPDYFNQEHRQTLDALGAMMGDKDCWKATRLNIQ